MGQSSAASRNNRANNKRPSLLKPSDVTGSLPSSPAIHASSHLLGPSPHTSAKTQAQRFALLHFLAIGPASEATVHQETAIPKLECSQLLHKFAKQKEPGSDWLLSEKWFKELDVWQFPYPSQEERQLAIDNAVRALDRQRLSREDKLWQLLLPKEDRGKGKMLSKLSLNGGLTPQPATSMSESIGAASDTSEQMKRLAPPGSENMNRSLSSERAKPKKSSEEAMTKRLLAPKKTAQPVRVPKTTTKEQDDTDKTKPTKGTKMAKDTTTAKAGIKRKLEPTVKSAESVENSDDNEKGRVGVELPAAKRLKTTTGLEKMSSQSQATSFKAGQKSLPAQGESSRKAPTGKVTSAGSSSSTPKVQPASVTAKNVTAAEKLQPSRNTERAKVTNGSASVTKESTKPAPKLDAADKAAKRGSTGVTTAKMPVAVTAQVSKQTHLPKQPPAPASASSASSSNFFSSLTSVSHRHSSSQSSISSASSTAKRPVIEKRMVPVGTLRKSSTQNSPALTGSVPQKRKMDVSPAKPSSLGSSPPVNASDFGTPSSGRSRALTSTDAPAFDANTPGQDIEMIDAPLPLSRVPSSENKLSSSQTLSEASSQASMPAKVELEISTPSTRLLLSLRADRQEAFTAYYKARIEAETEYEGRRLPEHVKIEFWRLFRTAEYMRKEVEARVGGIDSSIEDVATLSQLIPEGSAAFFRGKIHQVWKIYTKMFDEVSALNAPSQDQLKELTRVTHEVQELQKLHEAAQLKDRRVQIAMCRSPRNTVESEIPLSRRQTLDMYAAFQKNLAAYTSFQHELRTLPGYPLIEQAKLDQDAKMFDRLSEMRKEIFGGFQAMIDAHKDRPTGIVRLSDFLERNPMPTQVETELGVWRMRNAFDEWIAEWRDLKNNFGDLKPEGLKRLWEELDDVKADERMLIEAVALDFGAKAEGDLDEISLEKFEPLNGKKGRQVK